jgi:hypothetical protein
MLNEPALTFNAYHLGGPGQGPREETLMNDRTLDIAFWNYDRTRAFSDERVRIEGIEANVAKLSDLICKS